MDLEKNFVQLELNSLKNGEKIKISPIGKITGVDGRTFDIDAVSVLANTKAPGTDLVLDLNHFDGEAMGWFNLNSLELRDDGIYASLELTQAGADLVEKRSYRYLSPAYEVSYIGELINVYRIASVGLVNRPNLLNQSLNSKGETMDEQKELLAQIQSLKEQIEALQKENEALKSELKTSEDNARLEKIDNAIKIGEMLPNRKEAALVLEKNALNSFLEVCKSEAEQVLKQKSINKQDAQDLDPDVKAQLEI